jgi:hypothetical protein
VGGGRAWFEDADADDDEDDDSNDRPGGDDDGEPMYHPADGRGGVLGGSSPFK